ncbi:MAG TPA: hypothetical protein VG184_08370 [Acidimicrobiales bacterium]|nr:hypothetical protein [Acidimicrobiales bacterium]
MNPSPGGGHTDDDVAGAAVGATPRPGDQRRFEARRPTAGYYHASAGRLHRHGVAGGELGRPTPAASSRRR